MKKLTFLIILVLAFIGIKAQETYLDGLPEHTGALHDTGIVVYEDAVNTWKVTVEDLQSSITDTMESALIFKDSLRNQYVPQNQLGGTIDMDDYYESTYFSGGGGGVYDYKNSSTVINGNTVGSKPDVIYYQDDTLNINTSFLFRNEYTATHLSGVQTGPAGLYYHKGTPLYIHDYTGKAVYQWDATMLLNPKAGDTINAAGMYAFSTRIQTSTPNADDRIKLDEARVINVFSTWDDHVSIDSVISINIAARNAGIPSDSIRKYYAIFHENWNEQPLYGSEKTYFLYSEYGDNYLNGDLEVTGTIFRDSARNQYVPKNVLGGTIDMDDYPGIGVNAFNNASSTTDVILPASGHNIMNLNRDTINLSSESDPSAVSFHNDWKGLRVDSDVVLTGSTFNMDYRAYSHSNLDAKGVNGLNFNHRLETAAFDTIKIDTWTPFYVGGQTFASGGDNLIDVGEQNLLYLFGSYDSKMSVDVVNGIRIRLDENGIPADSVGLVRIIWNEDNSKLEGVDGTYFLYSEYGDNYLNGDLEVTGTIFRDSSRNQYTPKNVLGGTFSMDDYYSADYGADGQARVNSSITSSLFQNNSYSKNNFFDYREDTVTLDGLDKYLQFDRADTYLFGTSSRHFKRSVAHLYAKDFTSTSWIENHSDYIILGPDANDTIDIPSVVGYNIGVTTFTPDPTGIVTTEDLSPLGVYVSLDDYVSVDSVTMFSIYARDAGIDPDSIIAYYGIFHNGSYPVNGSERTYFLYSEYGDNYLNGDLEVTGLIKNEPPYAFLSFDGEGETLTMSDDEWVYITNATYDLFSTVNVTDITSAGDSITVSTPGHYKGIVTISFSGTTNADVYNFAIFKNGVITSPVMVRTTTSTDIGNLSLPFDLPGLVAGDDLSFRIMNSANDFDATMIACSWMTELLHTE